MNFVSLLLPLAVVGWLNFRRRLGGALAAALGAITLIEAAFVVRYPVRDQFTFLLPSLVMVALAAGVGVSALADQSRRWRIAAVVACAVSVVAPPTFYAVGPSLARAAGTDIDRARKLPRDELRYWLVPWKHNEASAERFAAAALKQAGPDGVIIPDSTSEHVLVIVQERDGLAPGVSVQFHGEPLPRYAEGPKAFRLALRGRRLYIVSPANAPEGLLHDAYLVASNDAGLWLVRWKDQ
ncbi:MAG: hypothetical protein ACYTF6_03505 [Planctomycetota bacterium]